MEHVRLRAPSQHGEALVLPATDPCELFEQNVGQVASFGREMEAIRRLARKELTGLAFDYSRQYADVERPESGDRVVMCGHQPTLFHPGVWLKNFALSHIGQKASAVSINLMVDNDLCQSSAVSVPTVAGEQVGLSQLAFDQPEEAVPFEVRGIRDRQTFESFGGSLASAMSPLVGDSLVSQLWPNVTRVSHLVGGGLAASVAAGRHLLELENGVANLELPIGKMAEAVSFARFFGLIANQAGQFAEVYNTSIGEYRTAHRIRSNSHPVPVLEKDGGWQEVPFWCWTKGSTKRKRLFLRGAHAVHLALSDGEKVFAKIDRKELAENSLSKLIPEVAIRPRALTTTMFARLFGCDLFIHGIGGAKYDQLTDRIVQRFLGVDLPGYLMVTATMRLPFAIEATTQEDVVRLQQQLREMKFHPERLLGEEQAGEPGRAKEVLLRTRPEGSRKGWHDELEKVNAAMADLLAGQRRELEGRLADATRGLASGRVINSREFGFPLFPCSLIDELREMAGGIG